MKRSRLEPGEPPKRKTPLKSHTNLRRRTPLQQSAESVQPGARKSAPKRKAAMASKPPAPAVPRQQKDRLRERAGEWEWCEIRQAGCFGRGTDPSHRVSRKMGGRRGDAAVESAQLSVLVWACRACHDMCHDQPNFAERMGWFVREGIDPRTVPVLIGGRKVLLDDEGGMTDARDSDRVA